MSCAARPLPCASTQVYQRANLCFTSVTTLVRNCKTAGQGLYVHSLTRKRSQVQVLYRPPLKPQVSAYASKIT